MATHVELLEADEPSLLTLRKPATKTGNLSIRMVVGVTTDQTCLVLRGRLRALREAGFEVTLTASPGSKNLLWQTAKVEGVSARPLPMRRGIAPLADLLAALQLWLLLRRLRPTVTDFSTPKAGLLGNLVAWALGVPHRVYTLRGLKLESTIGVKMRLLLASERLSARCAHVVLCNSESLLKRAVELRIAPASKMRVLGDGSSNGVDTDRFSPGPSDIREELSLPGNQWVIGFVGRLTTDKGVPELIEAFELILLREPQSWLLLVGWFDEAEDALEERWRRRVLEHPRIRHAGYVMDTAPYYRAMDVLVLPTHREGFPNVALEASASGIPVIATASTGAMDAVVPEVTGLQIPVGDPIAIAGATLELLSDDQKRKRLGKAGRKWVLEHFSQERVLGLAVEFYKSLLQ